MDLVNQQDVAVSFLSELILGVHQQQASGGSLPLAKFKQLQGSCADLQTLGSKHEGTGVCNGTHIECALRASSEASQKECMSSQRFVVHASLTQPQHWRTASRPPGIHLASLDVTAGHQFGATSCSTAKLPQKALINQLQQALTHLRQLVDHLQPQLCAQLFRSVLTTSCNSLPLSTGPAGRDSSPDPSQPGSSAPALQSRRR